MTTVSDPPPAVADLGTRSGARSWWGWAALIVVLPGIALRVFQYAALPSIWVDEAAIARNVLDRDAADLLRPLDYGQVAPPGFLLGVKLSTEILGISEYGLRLVPLLAGIASIVLFCRIARTMLRPVASIVATLMFSAAAPLIYFSSNLKQYSSDVAATLVVVAVAQRLGVSRLTPRTAVGFALLAAVLLFFSEAVIFPLTVAGAVLCADAVISHRPDARRRFAVVLFWAFAAAATLLHGFASMTPADSIYLHRFWAQGFVPDDAAATWIWTTAKGFFGPPGPYAFDGSLHYYWPALFVVLAAVGSVAMTLENPARGALLAGPGILTLVASAAHAYPFGRRVDLFLIPLLILLAVGGASRLGRLVTRRKIGEYLPVLLLPLAIPGLWQHPPPYKPEHLRPVMQYVADHWEPGDALWVYYGAGQAFEYYRRLIPIHGDIRVGDCSRTDPRDYLRQIDVERGRARVWILMSHDFGSLRVSERRIILEYLDGIGKRLDQVHAPQGDGSSMRTEAFLYDLSDRNRLDSLSAQRFPIREGYPAQTWSCYGTMSPFAPSPRVLDAVMQEDPR